MFIIDLDEAFRRRVDALIQSEESTCGKGVEDTNRYWRHVGTIRGLQKAKEEFAAIVKQALQDEDDND